MPSRFGWVDFDSKQQRKMLDVIKLFRDRDTRDELGIGTIRDAFSDYFFPGTTTIQTRARYFLFIPWIYRKTEKKINNKNWAKARIQEDVEYWEKRLIYALLEGNETDGVIGIDARDSLQRLPASIYWAGLGKLGIRRLSGSQSDYHRHLARVSAGNAAAVMSMASFAPQEHDEGEQFSSLSAWYPALPEEPDDFLKKTTHDLTREEAEFLRERILHQHPKSLFAAFVLDRVDDLDADFLWEHPIEDRLPEDLKPVIRNARDFSEAFHGVALLYNLMLAEKRENEEWVEEYQYELRQWADSMSGGWDHIREWSGNAQAFWASPALEGARIPWRTRTFVNNWLSLTQGLSSPEELESQTQVRELIRSRELLLKGAKRARLHGAEALARWRGSSGTGQLDYRWGVTKKILADIYQGLKRRRKA